MAKRLRRKNKRFSTIKIGETATPERRRQLGGVESEIVDRDASGKILIRRQKARMECVLDYYWRTRRLTEVQREAGLRFRAIYWHVQVGPEHMLIDNMILVDNGRGNHERKMLTHIGCVEALNAVRKLLSPAQDILPNGLGNA